MHVARDGSWLWQGESLAQYLGISSVTVNKADGSVWLTGCCDYDGMLHLAQDGTELAQLPWAGMTVAVNPADGSYWVSNEPGGRVTHFSKDNAELWHGGYQSYCFPAVNPVDGILLGGRYANGRAQIVHLAQDGTELSRTPGFDLPWFLAVNPADGSCWVADAGECPERPAGGPPGRERERAMEWNRFHLPLLAIRQPRGWFLLGGR